MSAAAPHLSAAGEHIRHAIAELALAARALDEPARAATLDAAAEAQALGRRVGRIRRVATAKMQWGAR